MSDALAGLGHNLGPTMQAGASWRKHCWVAARESLLPHLPIEVLRGRLRRAKELGLDYKTYASVRAASGRGRPRPGNRRQSRQRRQDARAASKISSRAAKPGAAPP